MKIIATSIVVLAAAASAGESNLRLGRNLKAPKGGAKGNGKALGYGSRCCRNLSEDACTLASEYGTGVVNDDGVDYDICNTDDLGVSVEDFAAGFNGCAWVNATSADDLEEVFECEYNDDRRRERELAPGGNGKGKGNAKGIGFYCCRGADSAKTCNTYTDDAGTAENPDSTTGCAEDYEFAADFNKCEWTVTDEFTGEGECDHVDLDSSE